MQIARAAGLVALIAAACGDDSNANDGGAAPDPTADAGGSVIGPDGGNAVGDGAPEGSLDGTTSDTPPPPPEVCDGIDNDGDGKTDEDLTDTPPACPPRAGVCASGGTAACTGAGGWKCTYTAPEYEARETKCDGLDNDCDGVVDEACTTCVSAETLWLASSTYQPQTFVTVWDIRSGPQGASSGYVSVQSGDSDKVDAIRIDEKHAKLYWVQSGLWRSNFNGTSKEQIASGSGAGSGLAIHASGDWIYWSNYSTIYRAPTSNLTNAQPIATGGVYIKHLVALGDHLYWDDNPGIRRANLDGTGVETLLPQAVAWALAIDPVDNRLYWVEAGKNPQVRYADLDGANPQTLATLTGIDKVQDMHVDVPAKHIQIAAEGFLAQLQTDGSGATLPSTGGNSTMDSIAISGCKH